MSGIRKADTLEELSLEYFNHHYSLSKDERVLGRLLKEARKSCNSHIEWNTYEVYHVDTILVDSNWRVQLRVKFNFDYSQTIPTSLVEKLTWVLCHTNRANTVYFSANGYPHEEFRITLSFTILYKD